MKINRFGKAEVLSPDQINLLFNEGLSSQETKLCECVCLYAACRINEACTLFTRDVFGSNGIRQVCYYVVLIPRKTEIREKYKFTRLSEVS
jgi:integrase/recombinase XerD